MVQIRVQQDESLNDALRRFKKECDKSGILSEIKKRKYYEKPSEARRRRLNKVKRKRNRSLSRYR
ncbi:MAG: 30S ribosomal protein S21 [bacterium]